MNTSIIGTSDITQEHISNTLFALSKRGNTNILTYYVSHLSTAICWLMEKAHSLHKGT